MIGRSSGKVNDLFPVKRVFPNVKGTVDSRELLFKRLLNGRAFKRLIWALKTVNHELMKCDIKS